MKNKFTANRLTRPLLAALLVLMLCAAALLTAMPGASAQTASSFAPAEDRLNVSQSWTNDAYFDYTTLRRNNDLGRDTKLVTTQTFGSKYTVKFTLAIDSEAWNTKTLFRIALDAADDTNTDSGKQIWVREHLITTDAGLSISPTEYGGSANLWQQTYRDGSGFGTFPQSNEFYEFMLDVDGNNLDLYIERKFDLPFTEPRFTITSETGFNGHLAFMSCDSAYEFRVGGVTVDYQNAEGQPAQFKGLFNADGSISGDFTETNCLWHSNLPDFNTQSVGAYYVNANNQIVSNFGLSGLKGVLEYELAGIENRNLWSNVKAGIRVVAGITDTNPDGYVLASLYNCYFNVGDDESSRDFNINDEIQGGLRTHNGTFKIKIELFDTYYRAYVAALLSGGYTNYYLARATHPAYEGNIPYTDCGPDAAADIAVGRLALTARHSDAAEDAPVTFSVNVLRAQTVNVDFQADGVTVKAVAVTHGGGIEQANLPQVPEKTGYTQTAPAWDKTAGELQNITADMTVNAVYTINNYTVTFKADGETVKTVTVEHGADVAAADIPVVPAKAGHTNTAPAWDKTASALQNVTGDITVNAVYTADTYTVTFTADGVTVKTVTVDHGADVAAAEIPDVPAKAGYTQTAPAWDKTASELQNVTGDIAVNAVYTLNTYTVTFKADGVTVKTVTVDHGGDVAEADIPEVPEKEGYTGEWADAELTAVTADITVEAEYTEVEDTRKGCNAAAGGGALFGLLVLGGAALVRMRSKKDGAAV